MSDEPRTQSLAKWLRSTVQSLTGPPGERYISKIVVTGKGNHYFSVTEEDGTYLVIVRKVDPEDI